MAVEKQSEKSLEAMKDLKVDTSSEVIDSNTVAAKDGSPFDDTSCISSSGDATSSFKESDLDQEYLMAEQGMYYPACNYYGYYYPGYDSSFCECDDSGYFLGSDGMDIQYPAIQADNGPLVYYIPGVHPGYNPYGPCMPGAVIGADGQYLGQPSYLPGPVFPQPLAPSGYFHSPVPFPWESSLFIDGAHGNAFCGAPAIPCPKPNFAAPNHTLAPLKPAPPSKSGIPGETKGSSATLDVPVSTGVLNQPLKPLSKVSQPGSGFQASAVMAKGYFPSCPSQGKGGLLYPNNPANVKANGRGWSGTEKLKIRNKVNGISDTDLLNEQNRGPRTNGAKNTWVSVVASVEASGAEISPSNNSSTTVIRRDQYNLSDFTTKYDDALFFVIKSYSEDDVHKSIKYNVWASTQGGNKRLDSAYQAAQERIEEKRCKCPVFLLFSVNTSGQFCGVAEMTGRVDFNKSMNFWQQDKWNGFFPVKWHIIKDVPNPQFRHIILENNENKPVTNSRDTQEVKLPQGIEMLNIFKNYSAKTSILDDFDFYESRQKAMQDRRSRPLTSHLEHLQKPNQGAQSIETADQKPAVVGQQPLELDAPSDKAEVQASSESKAKVEA